MKIQELIEKEDILKVEDVGIKFKEYLDNHLHNDVYLITQDQKLVDAFEAYLMDFHSKAIKKPVPGIKQDLSEYYTEIDKLKSAFKKYQSILNEWIKTEKEVNDRIMDVAKVLKNHTDAINKNSNGKHKKTLEAYEVAAKTCDEALPKNVSFDNLQGLKQFVTELNHLYISQNIINRFASFAHITVDYMDFNDTITIYIKNRSQFRRQELNAFEVNLSAPIQRLTRLLALCKTLLDKDFKEILDSDLTFKEELRSLNRKLLRVCAVINQLQKMYDHERKQNDSKVTRAITKFLNLIGQFDNNSTMTSQSTNKVIEDALILSRIDGNTSADILAASQNQNESKEESVTKSLITMAMKEESSTSEIKVSESFYSELDEIAHDLTPTSALRSSNSNPSSSFRNRSQQSLSSLSVSKPPSMEETPVAQHPSAPVSRQSSNTSLVTGMGTNNDTRTREHTPPIAASLPASSAVVMEPTPVAEQAPAAARQSSYASANLVSTPEATRKNANAGVRTSTQVNGIPSPNVSFISDSEDQDHAPLTLKELETNKKNNTQKETIGKLFLSNQKILQDYLAFIEKENEKLLLAYTSISHKKKNLTDAEKLIQKQYKTFDKQREVIRNVLKRYQALPQILQDVAPSDQIAIHVQAGSMFRVLTNQNFDCKTKIAAVAEFEIFTKKHIPISQRNKKKIGIASFILACCCAAATAFVGLSLVALLAAFAGPGPGVVALFLTFKGVTTAWAVAISLSAAGAGATAGLLGAHGFHKTHNEAKQLTDSAKEFAKEEPKTPTH